MMYQINKNPLATVSRKKGCKKISAGWLTGQQFGRPHADKTRQFNPTLGFIG